MAKKVGADGDQTHIGCQNCGSITCKGCTDDNTTSLENGGPGIQIKTVPDLIIEKVEANLEIEVETKGKKKEGTK